MLNHAGSALANNDRLSRTGSKSKMAVKGETFGWAVNTPSRVNQFRIGRAAMRESRAEFNEWSEYRKNLAALPAEGNSAIAGQAAQIDPKR